MPRHRAAGRSRGRLIRSGWRRPRGVPGRCPHGHEDCGTRCSRTVPADGADRTAGRGLRRPPVLRLVADPSELDRPGHHHRARHHAQLPAHGHHPGCRRGGRRRRRASPPVASSRSTRHPATSGRVPTRPRDRPARGGRPAGAPPGSGRIRRPRSGAAGGVAHHHDRCRRGSSSPPCSSGPTPSTAGSAPGAGSPGSPWRCPPGSPSPRQSTTCGRRGPTTRIMAGGFRPLRCNHWRHRPASSGSSPPSPPPSTRSPSSPEPPWPVPCPARSSGGG